MNIWKRLSALALSGALSLSLCACGLAGQPTAGDPTGSPGLPSLDPSAAADPDPSPTVEVDLSKDILAFSAGLSAGDTLLTVNGTEMPADLVLYWLAMSCANFTGQYGMFGLQLTDKPDPDGDATYADLMRDSAVNIAAYNALLRQKAAELGCLPTDAQVEKARSTMMADGQENYDLMKTAYGLSDQSMEFLFIANSYYENVLAAAVPAATEEMLGNYVYQVKHILLKTVDDNRQPLPDDQIAEKKKQAEDLLAQLQAADNLDAKFDELMNQFSEDGRGEDGALAAPDGYTAVPGEMVPEFEEASLALKLGELSGIVESTYGYHIILRGQVENPEDYADDCREYALDQQLSAMLEESELTRAPALDALDAAGFFSLYTAYQNRVMEDAAPAETDPAQTAGPVESGGVG